MSRQPLKSPWTRLRRHEVLEERSMLVGHGFGAAFAPTAFDFFAQAATQQSGAAGAQFAAHSQIFSQLGSAESASTSLTASLTDPTGGTGTATVTFQTGTLLGSSASVIAVSGDTAGANSTVVVTIGSTEVSVKLDASGAGSVTVPTSTFTTTPGTGTTAAVSGLTGSFTASTTTGSGSGLDCSYSSASGSSLTASVGTATVTYQTGKLLGVADSVIKITGDTADANASVDVTINSQLLGSVTLDSTGAGTLIVPTATLTSTVAAVSTISLTNKTTLAEVSGSFAAATSDGSDSNTGSGCGYDQSAGATLTASLTDPTGGGGAATVTYQTGKLLGVLQSVIKITGDTTFAGATVPVTLNGQSLGTVTLDSTGAATITVPTSTLTSTVKDPSIILVGTLSGSLTASTSSSTSSSSSSTSSSSSSSSGVFVNSATLGTSGAASPTPTSSVTSHLGHFHRHR